MKTETLLLVAAALSACEADDWGPDRLGRGHIDQRIEELRLGRRVYGDYCAGCHGEQGGGDGPAARFLDPKPRDFRLGRLKFGSVEGGSAPRDEDYLRIIDIGLSGTAMPRFNLLSLEQKKAVVAYVKTFYPDWSDDPPGAPVSPGQDPWTADRKGGVEAGKLAYYTVATCWSCHPAYESEASILKIFADAGLEPPSLRPNIDQGETKDSNWGAPIRAPDFQIDRIKTGFEVESIARVIASGVGGTAMPTWAGSLEPEQVWGIAYYVNELALKRGARKGN